MNHVYRNPQQLAEMYHLSRDGLGHDEISEKLQIPYGSVVTALRTIKTYLNGKSKNQQRQSKHYQEAVKLIRRQQREENATSPEPQSTEPISLRESFDTFQNEIACYIEIHVTKRTATLRAELQNLKEENDQLRKQVELLRSTNWVDALETKLTQEEV